MVTPIKVVEIDDVSKHLQFSQTSSIFFFKLCGTGACPYTNHTAHGRDDLWCRKQTFLVYIIICLIYIFT